MNIIFSMPLLALAAIMASCSSAPYSIEHEDNPWADDYADVAMPDSMDAWGTYNVHDPSLRKVGDYYYMYSTDAVYMPRRPHGKWPKTGFLQMRRSADLVNWDFLGWAFDSIPGEGAKWVADNNGGRGPGLSLIHI